VILRQPIKGLLRIFGIAVKLGPVAGGQDRSFGDAAVVQRQVAQGLSQVFILESNIFAD
jgi:hypothetical protein